MAYVDRAVSIETLEDFGYAADRDVAAARPWQTELNFEAIWDRVVEKADGQGLADTSRLPEPSRPCPGNSAIGFVEGTPLVTEHGRLPVEMIEPGTRILTLDNGLKKLRWIGSRTVNFIGEDDPERPVCLTKNVFRYGCPAEDLSVAPNHLVLINDWRAELFFGVDSVLISASDLVDGERIRVDTSSDQATFYHLQFDDHEVVDSVGLANGSTPHDTGLPDSREDFGNFGQHVSAKRPIVEGDEAQVLARAISGHGS